MTSKRALHVSVAVVVLYWVFYAARQLLREHQPPTSVSAIAINVCIRTVIVVGLTWPLLRLCGESIHDLGVDPRPTGRFLARTSLLAVAMFAITNFGLNTIFTALLGRGEPPIAALFRDPHDAPLWIFCAIVGGGFAEELTRAFVLTRFEKLLGRTGLIAALVVDSIIFGLGHLYQGHASAASSALTGVMCALIFLQRRRVIDAMAVHALFDLMGIAAGYALYAR
jgi:membrane protease YdiL (CAAX protease family)